MDDARATSRSAEAVWVPNRNGVFVNVAAAFAEALGAGLVVAGFNAEEALNFPDNSPAFVEAANAALALSTRTGVRVISYTEDLDKRQIVEIALNRGVPLNLTWSCYEDGESACGVCESCMRRARAMEAHGNRDT